MRTSCRFHAGLRAFLLTAAANRTGAAAAEFALILPFMLALWLGGVDLSNGLSAKFKVGLAARTVADLASQYVSIDNATMTGIETAASAVMAPYSSSNLIVTVSEVTTDANGNGTIAWSDSIDGTPHAVGTSVTLPASLQKPNISLLWGEVTYPFSPLTSYAVNSVVNLYNSAYFYPRLSSSVTRVNS